MISMKCTLRAGMLRGVFTVCMLCFFFGMSSAGTKESTDTQKKIATARAAYEGDKLTYAMEWASQDIAAHISFWVQAYQEVDAGTADDWIVLLSRKIPSQPIAVFEVMARTAVRVERFCPSLFIEAEEYEVAQWESAALRTLESFTFADPHKEELRTQCLQRIKEDYQKFPTYLRPAEPASTVRTSPAPAVAP